jgi:hypothetical protein
MGWGGCAIAATGATMIRVTLASILTCVLLSGCASQAEIAQRQAEQRMAIEGQQELTCLNYGLQPRTPAFADCMLRLAGMRQQRDILQQQQASARQQAITNSLSEAGAKLGQKPRPRTIDCDTQPVGSGSTTSCTEN